MNEKLIENNTIKSREIKRTIRILLSKFIAIRNKGYIESKRKGSTGIGMTFESELGKKEDCRQIPDYYGIEIKTKRAYSKSYITLFGISPKGPTSNEARRLRDLYGYPSNAGRTLKCLYSEVNHSDFNRAGIKYFFKLKLDKVNDKLILQIYDKNKNLIDEDTYWNLFDIKLVLYTKIKYLAYVKAWSKKIERKEYFKFFDIKFYVLKGFDEFLDLLQNDHIKLLIAINSSYMPNNYGQIMAHKISFAIDPNYLNHLFYLYEVSHDIIF